MKRIAALLMLWASAAGCAATEFGGSSESAPAAKSEPRARPEVEPAKKQESASTDQADARPPRDSADAEGPVKEPDVEDVSAVLAIDPKPDYRGCAERIASASQDYGSAPRCALDSVVVVVNDGKAESMICCPIAAGVLSRDPAKQYVERAGACGAGEVAVGIKSGRDSIMLCSAVDSERFETSPPVPSTRIKDDDHDLPPELALLAEAAHAGDTCICPQNHVVLGNHVYRDNVCGESCVEIRPK